MTDYDHGPYMEREFKKAAIRRAKLDLELDESIEEFCKPVGLSYSKKSIDRAERISKELDKQLEARLEKLKHPPKEGVFERFKRELSLGWNSFNILGKILFLPLIFVTSCLITIGFDKVTDKLFFKDI